jgi:hypothetical protein
MNDEEFKKKLEIILDNLYKIDREVREYVRREKPILESQKHTGTSYQRYEKRLKPKYKV